MPLFLNASDLAIYKLEMDFSYCLKFCVCIRCTGVAAVYQFDLFYLNKKNHLLSMPVISTTSNKDTLTLLVPLETLYSL